MSWRRITNPLVFKRFPAVNSSREIGHYLGNEIVRALRWKVLLGSEWWTFVWRKCGDGVEIGSRIACLWIYPNGQRGI